MSRYLEKKAMSKLQEYPMAAQRPTAQRSLAIRRVLRPLAALAVCGVVAFSLQGCIGILAGGAIAGGFAATDRRTLGVQADDKSIAIKGESRVNAVVGEPAHINVTSFNRKVLMTGEVRNDEAKQAAGREAATIPGVDGVFNELTVAEPSTLSNRSNDTYITSKVLASLYDAKDTFANAFKVVTERGVVYLMGRVTQREGDRGAEIARGVNGVQKVVTIYDYLTEKELGEISTKQPAGGGNAN
jgi:osmotically-inducible protein OsmY